MDQFEPHARRIAEASAEQAGVESAVLIPLIAEVLPLVLSCLSRHETTARAAASQALSDVDDRDVTRLAKRYWRQARRRKQPLTWDQATVLSRQTISAAVDVLDADLAGLTAAAVLSGDDIDDDE